MLIGTTNFFGFITISKVTMYIAIVLMYKRVYFNAVNTIIACIKERFDQPGFKICQSIEMLLIDATHHCVKSVRIRSYFWSVFSCIRIKYGDLLRKSPYSIPIQKNTNQK